MADHDANATPLTHSKHQFYRRFARVRHGKQFENFLSVQAARLSTTEATIFAKLAKYSGDQIIAATNLSQLP
jgi:hypothetical protein